MKKYSDTFVIASQVGVVTKVVMTVNF